MKIHGCFVWTVIGLIDAVAFYGLCKLFLWLMERLFAWLA